MAMEITEGSSRGNAIMSFLMTTIAEPTKMDMERGGRENVSTA
jgi:hypothetical protein